MTAETQTLRDRALLEQALAREGYTDVTWAEEDDRPVAIVGQFRVIEGDDDEPPYVDAEGELRATVVGAQEHRNERVHWGFREDGMDGDDEVHDLTTLDPIT